MRRLDPVAGCEQRRRGVELGDRRLEAATIVVRKAGPATLLWRGARVLPIDVPSARLPAKPVYGSNNWYYAYGRNVSAAGSLKDAA